MGLRGCGSGIARAFVGCGSGIARAFVVCGSGIARAFVVCGSGIGAAFVSSGSGTDLALVSSGSRAGVALVACGSAIGLAAAWVPSCFPPLVGSTPRTSNSVRPTRIFAPPPTLTGPSMRLPFTNVPFAEPRSSTSSCPPSSRTATWRRDTSASSIVRSAFSRPMISSPVTPTDCPARDPLITQRLAIVAPRQTTAGAGQLQPEECHTQEFPQRIQFA